MTLAATANEQEMQRIVQESREIIHGQREAYSQIVDQNVIAGLISALILGTGVFFLIKKQNSTRT